jgi:hypothetical protein
MTHCSLMKVYSTFGARFCIRIQWSACLEDGGNSFDENIGTFPLLKVGSS